MKRIYLIAAAGLLLSGCATFPSNKIHPDLGYREVPRVYLTEHTNPFTLQRDCFKRTHRIGIHGGCSFVPYDPKGTCDVHILKGDKTHLAEELWHCHGYMDTYLPWLAVNPPAPSFIPEFPQGEN